MHNGRANATSPGRDPPRVLGPSTCEGHPVDTSYLRWAVTDRLFYDDPARRLARTARYDVDPDRHWSGWRHHDDGGWAYWQPDRLVLPEQGWKIHVATTPAGARDLLSIVSGWCHDHGLAFKHLPDPGALLLRDAKDADRTGSGKFITIYPRDERELHATLTGLDALVGGRPGPYVLSDLRWGDGPLYVRFGAFVPRWTRDGDGARVPAVRAPDGTLVEDVRLARFSPPPWVDLPDFLRAQLDALGDDEPPAGFPEITAVLHYSNGGGVYEARADDGAYIVLKEARPYAGLTPDGRDAPSRLREEEQALRALAGPSVVALRDTQELHGTRFLVLDHVDGTTLNDQMVLRSPAIHADATRADFLAYRRWALDMVDQVRQALAAIHAAGYVHGDLHPGNVLVPAGEPTRVVLIDLEMAHRASEARPVVIGAPGFVAPDARSGIKADLYALACLELTLFIPLTSLFGLDPLKVDELVRTAQTMYDLDDAWAHDLRRRLALPRAETLTLRSTQARDADAAVRAWDLRTEDGTLARQVMIARSITASADFSRADRAWPGDPRQFTENAWSLAHGAAGVIHALDACTLDVPLDGLTWLDAAIARHTATEDTIPLGLYDGLAGVGWLQRRLGNDDAAERILDQVRRIDTAATSPDLYGGLSGIGLYLLSETGADPALEQTTIGIATRLRDHLEALPSLDPHDPAPTVRTGRGGLMWGPSGIALFALRLYERTGDPQHLALAEDALDRDLACCAVAVDGSLQINEGWRVVPFLATGSAGVGLVLAQLLRHATDPERYLHALDGIQAAARATFTIEPGLFYGRAGLIHLLVLLARLDLATLESRVALGAHLDALQLHAIRHSHGIAFPGHQLLRLSTDLATGSAGILTAVQAHDQLAHDDERPCWENLLPLLLPSPTTAPLHEGR